MSISLIVVLYYIITLRLQGLNVKYFYNNAIKFLFVYSFPFWRRRIANLKYQNYLFNVFYTHLQIQVRIYWKFFLMLFITNIFIVVQESSHCVLLTNIKLLLLIRGQYVNLITEFVIFRY